MKPLTIYEIVDASSDEQYFPLGTFLTLEQALKELDKATAEGPYSVSHEFSDSYGDPLIVEIRERKIGWSEEGKLVFYRLIEEVYDEEKDEYNYEVTYQTNVKRSKQI